MTTRTIVSLSVPTDSEQMQMILDAKKKQKNVSKFILGCMSSTSIGKERHITALQTKVEKLEKKVLDLAKEVVHYRHRDFSKEKLEEVLENLTITDIE